VSIGYWVGEIDGGQQPKGKQHQQQRLYPHFQPWIEEDCSNSKKAPNGPRTFHALFAP